MALEEAFQVTLDEAAFGAATTVGDLAALVKPLDGATARPAGTVDLSESSREKETIAFPSWNRSLPVRAIRRASLPTWILPLGRIFARITVEGLDHLEQLDGPVIFAANHQSHLDTPVILDSLPPQLRYRVATAMAKEFFKPHFYPEQFGRAAWFTNSLNYYLAAVFFNAFPLPQREAGTRQTLRYIGDLIGGGYSVLIFPEGKRTQSGEVGRVPARHRDDRVAPRSSGRPRQARRAGPHPPSERAFSHARAWALCIRDAHLAAGERLRSAGVARRSCRPIVVS